MGFDPGGEGAFGVALLRENGASPAVMNVSCAVEAVRWVRSQIDDLVPSAAGIDTLAFWSGGLGGWREADRWLRNRYADAAEGVLAPNSLRGSMLMQGMSLAILLRRCWPDLPITETHPKILYYACSKCRHQWVADREVMRQWLSTELNCSFDATTDHEFDALTSAWAARQGFSGAWSRDLRKLSLSDQVLEPAGPVHYWWPD